MSRQVDHARQQEAAAFPLMPSGGDDSQAIQAAAAKGQRLGVGVFQVSQPGVLESGYSLQGVSPAVTVLKLTDGANCDVLTSKGFAALTGKNTIDFGPAGIVLRDFSIDGNKSRNTKGFGIRMFAHAFVLDNIWAHDCAKDAAWLESSPSAQPEPPICMYAVIRACRFSHSNGSGLTFLGPHDSVIDTSQFFRNGLYGLETRPGAVGTHVTNCHSWGGAGYPQDNGFRFGGTVYASNCQAEGSSGANVYIGSDNCQWSGGKIYSNPAWVGDGKIGVELNANGFLMQGAYLVHHTNGTFKFNVSSPGSLLDGYVYQLSGNVLTGVAPSWQCTLRLNVAGGAVINATPPLPTRVLRGKAKQTASTLGVVNGKIEVLDDARNSLGFLPVYRSIT